jgi:hypothetical protein
MLRQPIQSSGKCTRGKRDRKRIGLDLKKTFPRYKFFMCIVSRAPTHFLLLRFFITSSIHLLRPIKRIDREQRPNDGSDEKMFYHQTTATTTTKFLTVNHKKKKEFSFFFLSFSHAGGSCSYKS